MPAGVGVGEGEGPGTNPFRFAVASQSSAALPERAFGDPGFHLPECLCGSSVSGATDKILERGFDEVANLSQDHSISQIFECQLGWSFTTLPVAAKYQMTSVPDFLLLETGFALLQFAVVAPLIALAYRE